MRMIESAPGFLARGAWRQAVTALVVLLTARVATAASEPCTSGILQIAPLPPGPQQMQCMGADPISVYGVKAICGAAFKVTVDKGIIRMVPLELDTIKGDFGLIPPRGSFGRTFDCRYHNASGLFTANSKTAAAVMLYDDKNKALSSLTKTGPNQASLLSAHTYDLQSRAFRDPQCTYVYKVVSGCVLGAKAPTPTPDPTSCPPGYVSKLGRYGLTFCTPCPSATYSAGGPHATTCMPCPIGTANLWWGAAVCHPCGPGEFAPKAGLKYCRSCCLGANTCWTDSKTKCERCPADSTKAQFNRSQCVRCYAGKKCCTVNWDKDCPKCTSAAKPATYTSTFALESATPASCLGSANALGAPKFKITIDGACQITLSSPAFNSGPLPVQGVAASALTDLSVLRDAAQFSSSFLREPSLLDGNVTAVNAPYLYITVKSEKCTYRYRALTKPAAAILGATPKAAPSAPCPAGTYRDTTTDTKPGPCLPCPPGTTSTKARTCAPCPSGTYAGRYGSSSCTKCPVGKISKAGASKCTFCEYGKYANRDRRTCSSCPKNTAMMSFGTGACLGMAGGSICCAAGACGKQTPCGSAMLTAMTGQAFFRFKSSDFSSPHCRNVSYLTCLGPGTRLAAYTMELATFTLQPADAGTKCATDPSAALPNVGGGIAATNRGVFSGPGASAHSNAEYELLTNPATRTFTLYLSNNPSVFAGPTAPAPVKGCSATFELRSGYFLDLKPRTTTCPAAAITEKAGSRTLCQFCGIGRVKTSKGTSCKACHRGTFQRLFDGTSCKPCPRGHSCSSSGATPKPCSNGSYSPKQGLATNCLTCPSGTFSASGANVACTKCPPGTSAPRGSAVCSVPFQTKF